MKTTIIRLTLTVCAVTLISALVGRVGADDATTDNQEVYKGVITRLDEKTRTLEVKGFLLSRTFHLGEHCRVWLEDKPDAALTDLRPGYRVEVNYVETGGVKVATQIAQHDLTYEGHLSAIDPQQRTLKVRSGLLTRTFRVPEDCRISIRDDSGRKLEDLQLGHKVTVKYASVEGHDHALEILEKSLIFTGTLEAIDAQTDTIKASQLLSTRTFQLAKDCQIIVDGKPGGELRDLRIGQRLTVSYEDVDGVLVANRLGHEPPSQPDEEKQLTRTDHREP